MTNILISNLTDVSFCLVSLFIAVRSFDVYAHSQYRRLLILGLSMLIVTVSVAADFIANYERILPLHTDWFLYIGQACAFLFILLSLFQNSERYLSLVAQLNMLAYIPLLPLLLLAGLLPNIDSNMLRSLLEGTRWFICFSIFFLYFSSSISRPTTFNRLMSLAFFLLSFGYFMSMEQDFTVLVQGFLINSIGDITGLLGLITLVIAVSWN